MVRNCTLNQVIMGSNTGASHSDALTHVPKSQHQSTLASDYKVYALQIYQMWMGGLAQAILTRQSRVRILLLLILF